MEKEESEGYQAWFVSELTSALDIKPGTILVAPSSDRWNDFGERVLIDIVIQPRRIAEVENERLEFSGFFGFLDAQSGKSDTLHLRELVDQDRDAQVPATEVPPFFTMLPDMASYRRIVGHLGPDEARLALSAINDMVEADDRPAGRPWLRVARESQIFLNAFLRHTESYFTWKNAAPILQGAEFEELGQISDGLRVRFQLAGRPNEHDLKFRFSHSDAVLPQRLAVVIGKNGVGKSQTLAQIVDAALFGKAKLTDLAGERPLFNRILGFYPSAASSSVFPPDRRKRARVWYRRFSMVSGRSRQTTSDLIIQLARSTERIGVQSRYDIFLNAITAIEGYRELVLRVKSGERGPVAIQGLNHGGEQETIKRYASINVRAEPVRMVGGRTYPLSSGELSFLRFAALAALYIENGTLLLFDEPETHLHPNFISQFVALLDRLLEQTGSAAILSTHSVYFVREALEGQVTVLRSDADRAISAETPTLKTFGADVGAISYFVFGEDQPSRLALEVEDKIMERTASWRDVFEQYKDRISLDLLGEIRARVEGTDREADGE
jgi:ABC-type Mn2+/Zn2+ transport system ATPase subunit